MKHNVKETESAKLFKEGKTLKVIGIVGGILCPLPFVWNGVTALGERKQNVALMMNKDGLIGIVVGVAESNPELLKEFVEGFGVLSQNLQESIKECEEKKGDEKAEIE